MAGFVEVDAVEADVKEGRGRWWIVALLFLGILVSYIDRGNLSVAAVPMMRDLGLAPPGMGALLSAFFWSYGLGQIPAGYVIDRFGFKWTYAAAFLLWSVASAGVGIARSFREIFLLRLLLGFGEAVAPPASLAYIKRQFRVEEQGFPTGIYISGMMVGPALGAFLGAVLLDRAGWRTLFILTGLAACVWVVPWLLVAPARLQRKPQIVVPIKTSPSTRSFPWKQILASPVTWGITIGAFFYSYFWYFCLTWLPSYLVMAHGFSFLKMGAYVALPMTGMAAMSLVCGHAADRLIARLGRPLLVRQVFVCAGFVAAGLILLILAVHSSSWILAILLISLTGLGFAAANYWALTQVISPTSVIGRVIGYQNTIAQLGGVCAPIITGVLVGNSKDFRLPIVIAGVSPLVAGAAIVFLIREAGVKRISAQFPGD